MSYILEALKKADQERTLGSVPDLETPHWGVRRSPRRYRWIWVVAALLLVNGVLLAFLLGRGSGDDAPTASASATRQAIPEPVVPVSPVPGAGTTVVTRPRDVIQPAPAQPRVRPQVVTQTSAPVIMQEPAPATATAGLTEPVPAHAPRPGVQLWSDLPLEFRSTFPLPHIDVHVYADQPARRFILVDLQKYREGDTLDSGAVIEKILPQGLQLYYQGTRFEIEK
jgi:general secretion pathway protein B